MVESEWSQVSYELENGWLYLAIHREDFIHLAYDIKSVGKWEAVGKADHPEMITQLSTAFASLKTKKVVGLS